ncbi:MAG: glycosyl transferase [Mycobacteriales bacterium]
MTFPAASFAHRRALTDDGGLYEHADRTAVRPEHGYCVDDVARGLVVVSRSGSEQDDLRRQYLAFLLAAQSADGRFRNRRDLDLSWSDEPSVEDCWGRALWGLGATAAAPGCDDVRERSLRAFERGAPWRSPHTRAMAFAGLGAAEVLRAQPDHEPAMALLDAAARHIGTPSYDGAWPWPEPRLSYANAALPDVLLAAGHALDKPLLVAHGLMLLGWLLTVQTRHGHLSVVPVGGLGPHDTIGGFDQQPIEVAALADACARAFALTHDRRWSSAVELTAAWFLGHNDAGTSLLDVVSGGGCDGLEPRGRNDNQGAESTLALLSTLQHAQALALTGS